MSLTKATYAMVRGAPANVLDFGADSTGVADCTAAFNAALAAASSVYVPAGTYRVNTQILVAANKQVYGDGFSSIIKFYGGSGAFAFYCGDSTVALNYGIQINNLEIQPMNNGSGGVYLYGTSGAVVSNVRVSANVNYSNKGFVIDGGNVSSFFNILQNCYALHCSDIGFDILTTGISYSTINYFIDCSAFGDLTYGATSSIGMNFTAPDGTNSVILGGNMEDCGIGINLTNSTGINFFGTRFENCTTDINASALTQQCNFIGCQNVDDVVMSFQNGYGRNMFIGCSGTYGNVNKQESENILYSNAAAKTPQTIIGYPSQSAPLLNFKNSANTVLAQVLADGKISVGGQSGGTNVLTLSGASSSTVGAAGGASALPATPSGYLVFNLSGTSVKVPYYTA